MLTKSFRRLFRTHKQPIHNNTKRRRTQLGVENLEKRDCPANFTAGDLAVLQLGTNGSDNTTGTVLELSPSTANQSSPTLSIPISTMSFSDSGTSGFLTDSNDGTLLNIAAYNVSPGTFGGGTADLATDTAANARGIATLNNSTTFNLATTYTETASGDQTRSATTTDDSTFAITDKGGLFTNSATSPTLSTNILVTRTFGGTIYVASTKATAAVSTISSPTATSLTALPGLPANDGDIQDFYLIQSGSNGSTYDVLYTIDQGGGDNIMKYSLVSGSWVSNGEVAFTANDTSMIAANDGAGGAYLYVVTTAQAANNTVERLTDTAGYNQTININTSTTTGSNPGVVLYTDNAASGGTATTTLKGIAFAPVSAGSTAPQITSGNSTNVYYQNAASTFQVTASGNPSPTFSLTGAPSWVTINSTTGLLSINTPNAPTETSTQNYSFTITASNGVGAPASQTFTVSVVYGDPTITSANNTSVYAGLSSTFQVTAEAGPPVTGYSLSGAPSWASINSSTGVITFTNPAAVSTTTNVSFTVNVTNSVGTTPQTFTVTELPTIGYATQGSNYTQNFSTLGSAGDNPAVFDGGTLAPSYDLTATGFSNFGSASGLTGWYAVNLDSGNLKLAEGEPSTTTGALFDFNDGTAGSQSLGTISTNSSAARFGAVFVNTTGTTLNTFTLSYTGEQWWANSGSGTGMTFSYNLSAGIPTAINPPNPVGALGFGAPQTGSGSYLDGSQLANQVSVNGTVNNITWLPGQALTITWDKGTTGTSDGLGIANLKFSASYQAQYEPTITNAPSAYATVGTNGTYQLTASALPAPTWSLSGYGNGSVPSWITVNSSTGVLSFTNPPALPTNGEDAAFTVVVTANNGVGTAATQTFTVIETNPASNFTPGDLLLYQTGNNNTSDPKYAAEAPVSLQEISTTGTPVENVPIPDNLTVDGTGNQPLSEDLGTVANGNGTGDGQLELSYNGTNVAFGGNDANLNQTTFSTADRVIGVMGNSPSSLDTTTYGQFNAGDDNRGAVEYSSSVLYNFGHTTNGGLRFFPGTGNSPTVGTEVDTGTTKNNIRDAIVGFNGQVYYSTDKSTTPGIFISATSSGVPVYVPTGSGDVDDEVIDNPAGNNPNGMFLADMNGDGVLDTGDRMYFLDASDGLYVSTYTSPTGTNPYGTWSTAVAVNGGDPVTANINYNGLTGQVTGSGVQLYFNSVDGTGNSSVWSLLDTGSASQTATEIASTTSGNGGMEYSGVAFAPYASATSITMTINGSSASSVAAIYGNNVTFVATVSTALAGTTVYFDNTANQTEIGSAVVQSNGTATFTTSGLAAGQYTVEAYTGGNPGSFAPAASTTQALSVTGSTASQATIGVSLNPSTVNESVAITATIAPTSGTGAYPTGTVNIYSNGQLLGTVNLSSGTEGSGSSVAVTLNTAGLALGTDTIVAVYSGDSTYESATSSNYSETVNPGATIAVATSNADPAWNAGSPPSVTLTAIVTGNGLTGLPNGSPSGTVQFYINNEDGSTTNIGSPVALSESGGNANVYAATTTYTFTVPGSVQIEAQYLPGTGSEYATVTTLTNSVPGLIDTAVKAFTVGDLIALERPAQFSNASNPVYLIEFTTGGSIVQQIILPIASSGSTNIVGLSPHASTEGALALSGNGSYLTLEGFDLAIGTSGAASSPSSTVPRTTASITNAGVIDTSTAVEESGNSALTNVRGAVTFDGQEFWIAGDSSATNSGLQYALDGATGQNSTTSLAPDDSSYTDVQIIGGNLYVAGGAGVISEVTGTTDLPGTTIPTDATVTPLPGLAAAYASDGLSSPAPYGFVMYNDSTGSTTSGVNVLYVGDQNYGLLKFYFNGTDWVFAGQRLNNSGSVEGLTGTWSSSGVTLYMTAAQGTGFPGNEISYIVDSTAYNQPFAQGNLITALYTLPEDNTSTFSGIAFAPLPMASVTAIGGSTTYGSETLSATVASTDGNTATGTVDFFANGTYVGSAALNGSSPDEATLTIPAGSQLPLGTYSVTARYDGDSNNGGNTSSPATVYVSAAISVGNVVTDAATAPILSTSVSGTTVTVTTDGNVSFTAGDPIVIAGTSVSADNGAFHVAQVLSATSFTYTDNNAGIAAATGGTVTDTASGATGSLGTGVVGSSQRSMVDAITYSFNQAVNLGAGAFTLAVASGQTGTLPSGVAYSSADGGYTWVVTFTGVTGNSIANGVYTITLNNSAVTAVAGAGTLAASRQDTFYRLFGDNSGSQIVNNADNARFKQTYLLSSGETGFNAAFDYSAAGIVNNADNVRFKNDYLTSYTGFSPTI